MIDIKIEGKYGSEFQRRHIERMLIGMMVAVSDHVKSTHQKNKLKITINNHNIYDLYHDMIEIDRAQTRS